MSRIYRGIPRAHGAAPAARAKSDRRTTPALLSSPDLIGRARPRDARRWPAVAVLAALGIVYLGMRLPHLSNLPTYGDEAIYLRWAQLIREDPGAHLWVSMIDAKLPLHYWLLALFFTLTRDPILSGRVLSVLLGLATIVPLVRLSYEVERLERWREERAAGGLWPAAVAVLFVVFSPLIAWFQRLALAEALLMLEAVALAWSSLRLARLAACDSGPQALMRNGLGWGVVWGAMLVTKQNFSYLHAALPVIALALYGGRGKVRALAGRAWRPLLAGGLLAGAMFVPVLFTDDHYSLRERLVYKVYLYDRTGLSPGETVLKNLAWLLIPRAEGAVRLWPHSAESALADGALWVYLTPPVCLVVALAPALWAARRCRGAALFFGTWSALLLLALLGNANMSVVRYAVLGLMPLVLLAARAAAHLADTLAHGRRGVYVGVIALALAWPGVLSVWQVVDSGAPTLLAGDRRHYLHDSIGGGLMERTTAFFREEADKGPLVLLTNNHFGQSEYFWLMLKDHPNIQLYCCDWPTVPMKPYPHDTCLVLGTENWILERKKQVTLPAGRRVFRIVTLLPQGDGTARLEDLTRPGPFDRCVRTFYNAPPAPGRKPVAGVVVLRLDDCAPGGSP